MINGRRTPGLFLLSVLVCQSIGMAQSRSTENINGFAPAQSDTERRFEEQFRAVPSAATARLTLPVRLKTTPRRFTFAIKCAASVWNLN